MIAAPLAVWRWRLRDSWAGVLIGLGPVSVPASSPSVFMFVALYCAALRGTCGCGPTGLTGPGLCTSHGDESGLAALAATPLLYLLSQSNSRIWVRVVRLVRARMDSWVSRRTEDRTNRTRGSLAAIPYVVVQAPSTGSHPRRATRSPGRRHALRPGFRRSCTGAARAAVEYPAFSRLPMTRVSACAQRPPARLQYSAMPPSRRRTPK